MEQDKIPEISPHIYGQSTTKEARIYSGEKTVFNKWCWENWAATCKKREIRTLCNTIHKNKLKMD